MKAIKEQTKTALDESLRVNHQNCANHQQSELAQTTTLNLILKEIEELLPFLLQIIFDYLNDDDIVDILTSPGEVLQILVFFRHPHIQKRITGLIETRDEYSATLRKFFAYAQAEVILKIINLPALQNLIPNVVWDTDENDQTLVHVLFEKASKKAIITFLSPSQFPLIHKICLQAIFKMRNKSNRTPLEILFNAVDTDKSIAVLKHPTMQAIIPMMIQQENYSSRQLLFFLFKHTSVDTINEFLDLPGVQTELKPITQPDSQFWGILFRFLCTECKLKHLDIIFHIPGAQDMIPILLKKVRSQKDGSLLHFLFKHSDARVIIALVNLSKIRGVCQPLLHVKNELEETPIDILSKRDLNLRKKVKQILFSPQHTNMASIHIQPDLEHQACSSYQQSQSDNTSNNEVKRAVSGTYQCIFGDSQIQPSQSTLNAYEPIRSNNSIANETDASVDNRKPGGSAL